MGKGKISNVTPYSRCAATACLTASVTWLAEAVPVCQEHLAAVQRDMIQRDMIRAPARRKPPRPPVDETRPSLVYYVRMGDLIKIGTSVSPSRRWYRLACEQGPVTVLMAEPGGQAVELKRHAQFVHHRIRATEMFSPAVPLLAHIAALATARPDWWDSVVKPVHEASSPKGRPRLAMTYTLEVLRRKGNAMPDDRTDAERDGESIANAAKKTNKALDELDKK